MAAKRNSPPGRAEFRHFEPVATRWNDNDIYGHLNNAIHYMLFDTAVNRWLIETAGCDPRRDPAIGLVVQCSCDYFSELAYPDALEVGIAVRRLGNSAVEYRLGLFRVQHDLAAAAGSFTHVYVNRDSRRPQAIAPGLRQRLSHLCLPVT